MAGGVHRAAEPDGLAALLELPFYVLIRVLAAAGSAAG